MLRDCCRKETARCRNCSFGFKVRQDIQYKFKTIAKLQKPGFIALNILVASKAVKIHAFDYSTVLCPLSGNPSNIRTNLPETIESLDYVHFRRWKCRSIFIQIFVVGYERWRCFETECNDPSRSSKIVNFGTIRYDRLRSMKSVRKE